MVQIGPPASATTGGTLLWASLYNGPASADDTGYAVAASPNGTAIFVTGSSFGQHEGDYATVAYAGSTGTQVWARRYDGPVGGMDIPNDIAVSPDGSRVFVTGTSDSRGGVGWATVAYDTAKGSTLWIRRHRGGASAVAPSLDGSMVFVTGSAHDDFATIAYNAETGTTLWASRYDGPASFDDGAAAIFVTGGRVFVTGNSYGSAATLGDYATVAYEAATGTRIWVRRYNGSADGYDFASAIVGSADGSRLFVSGESLGRGSTQDFATIAYEGQTGKRLWTRRFDRGGDDEAFAAATTWDGSSVFVTGISYRWPTSGGDFATVAYDGASGARTWVERYTGPGANYDSATAIAASPNGTEVYVTGFSFRGSIGGEDVSTLAYGAATGSLLWSRSYDGLDHETDGGSSIATSTDGSKVFVTGKVGYTHPDYVTIAYAA